MPFRHKKFTLSFITAVLVIAALAILVSTILWYYMGYSYELAPQTDGVGTMEAVKVGPAPADYNAEDVETGLENASED